MARLDYICQLNMGQSPDSTSYNDKGKGLPFFQGNADFGIKHPTVRVWCDAPTKIAHAGDVLISVRAPIGALNIALEDCCIGRGLAALTVHEHLCNKGYLWHAIASKVDELNAKGTGSTFKAISKNVLAETEIPLPDLSEQEHIARVLDEVDTLISLRKQQIAKLDELVKARFVEMFGDPVQNPMSWVAIPLMEMGYCKNGMNFHTGDSGVVLRCLGVGDFKDLSIIDGTDNLPTVSLNEMPPDEYMLQNGDIVFVRSNGNKALVGRCLMVFPHSTPTTYSGFCIRYRLTSDRVDSVYLLHVLKTKSMREKMAGRGANIQNLNQQILSSLIIPVPPFDLQHQFAAFVAQTDQQKLTIQHSLAQLELLKKALMQKYFG